MSFLGQDNSLEKEMATHSGILAWRIPWTEEPGGLQSTVTRVGHDSAAKPPPQLARTCSLAVSAERAEKQQHPGSKQPPTRAQISVSNSILQQYQGSLEK